MPPPQSLPKRILIVEDEALIGITLADLLKEEGFLVVGPVSNARDALVVLDEATPEAVVLDLSLQDGYCAGLARELVTRGTPFLIFSGHRREGSYGAEFQDVPWVEKPGRGADIVAELHRITKRHSH